MLVLSESAATRVLEVPSRSSASRQTIRTCNMQTFLVRTEPGSGGCLDALNPLFETLRERETRGARIAPTPSPPLRSGTPLSCLAVLERCSTWGNPKTALSANPLFETLNPRGTRGTRAAPQTPLRMGCWYLSIRASLRDATRTH